jgi:hypothetical protein
MMMLTSSRQSVSSSIHSSDSKQAAKVTQSKEFNLKDSFVESRNYNRFTDLY